eukprot:TRINITY_DN2327_c0_g1_i1.p1 TRINITY_DN2327_c0_g1~~TRINITY_DN2327_c0_g1_i1.p1  ORF type:complete len:309 (+),score=124.61 TRINITY_DN2327_c0_g1_i1:257-1183(+)
MGSNQSATPPPPQTNPTPTSPTPPTPPTPSGPPRPPPIPLPSASEIKIQYSKDPQQKKEEAQEQFLRVSSQVYYCRALSDYVQQLQEKKKEKKDEVKTEDLEKAKFLLQACETQFDPEMGCKIPPESIMFNLASTPLQNFNKAQKEAYDKIETCFKQRSDVFQKLQQRQLERTEKLSAMPAEGVIPGFFVKPKQEEGELKSKKGREAKAQLLLTSSSLCKEERRKLSEFCSPEATHPALKASASPSEVYRHIHNNNVSGSCKLRAVGLDSCIYSSICADALRECVKLHNNDVAAFVVCSQSINLDQCL